MPILAFILPFIKMIPPKVVIGFIAFAALILLFWYVKDLGYKKCEAEHLKAKVTQMERFNEIQVNRPDTISLIKRLQDGKF
jgi:hypothetical protein